LKNIEKNVHTIFHLIRVASAPPTDNKNMSSNRNRRAVIAVLAGFDS
jgi:hypothetical protein